MKLNVWSPLPPSPSGIGDYVAEQLGLLARRFKVTAVVVDPGAVDPATAGQVRLARPGEAPEEGLDLYHLGNSPSHTYVYRAALARPGVVVLHDWCLHHLVLRDTLEAGDRAAYLREMRRSYGEAGTFVGRQVARGLGGDLLPSLYPLNDRVLDGCLALVGLTGFVASRAGARLSGRPVLKLPHHLALGGPVPSRADARRALGLPADALLLTAPGLATASKRLEVAIRVVARLRARFPTLRLVVAGGRDPRLPLESWAQEAGIAQAVLVTGRLALVDFLRHLAAADIVLALRYPTHGEISGALVRALGVGRPALVTAATPAAEEFPEGIVVPVSPGAAEDAELEALLAHLLEHAELRETIGRLAAEHASGEHDLDATVERLAGFLVEVGARRQELLEGLPARGIPEGSLLGFLMEELRFGALDLGLPGVPPGIEPLLTDLAGPGRRVP